MPYLSPSYELFEQKMLALGGKTHGIWMQKS